MANPAISRKQACTRRLARATSDLCTSTYSRRTPRTAARVIRNPSRAVRLASPDPATS